MEYTENHRDFLEGFLNGKTKIYFIERLVKMNHHLNDLIENGHQKKHAKAWGICPMENPYTDVRSPSENPWTSQKKLII